MNMRRLKTTDLLLKEYVKCLLEGKPDPKKAVIPDKILGYLAEHATVSGLGKPVPFQTAVRTSADVPEFFANATPAHKKTMKIIFDKCTALATQSLADVNLEDGVPVWGNTISKTAKVDVMIMPRKSPKGVETVDTVVDVHVKFNDFDRLIGLQADSSGGKIQVNSKILGMKIEDIENWDEWPVSARYKVLRNKFAATEFMNYFNSKEGRKRYAGVELMPGALPIKQLATTEFNGSSLELEMFANPKLRRMFLDFLSAYAIPDLIRDKVAKFVGTAQEKPTYFFKYGTSPSSVKAGTDPTVTLDVDMLIGEPGKITIEENMSRTNKLGEQEDDTTTYPYTINYNNNPVFLVETRTSGEGHPMQIKVYDKKIPMKGLIEKFSYSI